MDTAIGYSQGAYLQALDAVNANDVPSLDIDQKIV
jgi:hypothetical protein